MEQELDNQLKTLEKMGEKMLISPKRDLEFRKKLFTESEEKRKDKLIDNSYFLHKSNLRRLAKDEIEFSDVEFADNGE